MFSKHEACMWVDADTKDSTEGVPCEVMAVHFDDGEPYYSIAFADGSARETVASRLRGMPVVGSKRPHAQLHEALEARPPSHVAAAMSLRNNEPELASVLEKESLPFVNVPTTTVDGVVRRGEGRGRPRAAHHRPAHSGGGATRRRSAHRQGEAVLRSRRARRARLADGARHAAGAARAH